MEGILPTHWLATFVIMDTPDLEQVQEFVRYQESGILKVPNAKVCRNDILL